MTVETLDRTSMGLEFNKTSPEAGSPVLQLERKNGPEASVQFAETPKLRLEGSGFGSTWKKVTVFVVKWSQVSVTKTRVLLTCISSGGHERCVVITGLT